MLALVNVMTRFVTLQRFGYQKIMYTLTAYITIVQILFGYTVKSESIHSVGFGFSSISPSNLGQISKSGTVLKSTRSQLFKTVPDFEI